MLTDFIKMLYRINFISIWEIQRTHSPFPRLFPLVVSSSSAAMVFILSVFIASMCPLLQQGMRLSATSFLNPKSQNETVAPMCLPRLSPKRLSSPSTAPPLARESAVSFWKHPCYFSANPHRWMFPSFFADALRAAHHMLFPPRDLIFPKLFGTESPEDVTGEKRPLSVMAFSAQHTCQDTFLHSFLPRLPAFAVWFWNSQSVSCLSLGVLGSQACVPTLRSSFRVHRVV